MRLSDITMPFDATLARDGEFSTLSSIHSPMPNALVFAENALVFQEAAKQEWISALILPKQLSYDKISETIGVIYTNDPKQYFFTLHEWLVAKGGFYSDFSFPSVISPSACISPAAYIAPRGVVIGNEVKIGAKAVILEGTTLEDQVVIGSGCVIGDEGFEVKKYSKGPYIVTHTGGVYCERGVEIQANSTVSRGLFHTMTRIGAYTKLSSGVHVAHSATIGSCCILPAGVLVGGHCQIKDFVRFGIGAVLKNRIVVGERAVISTGAVVISNVDAGEQVSGNFARPHFQVLTEQFLRVGE